ncbi:hypothetical protein AAMO2058_000461800 [Amorphochlora amoebiformis]
MGALETLYGKLGSPIARKREAAVRSLRFKIKNRLVEASVMAESEELFAHLIKWVKKRQNKSSEAVGLMADLTQAHPDAAGKIVRFGGLKCVRHYSEITNNDPSIQQLLEKLNEFAIKEDWKEEYVTDVGTKETALEEKEKDVHEFEERVSEVYFQPTQDGSDLSEEIPENSEKLLCMVSSDMKTRERMARLLKYVSYIFNGLWTWR